MKHPRGQLTHRQRLGLYACFAFAFALSSLAATKVFPNGSFLVTDARNGLADSVPSPGFSVGSVRWDVEQFQRDKSPTPFRNYFFDKCGGRTGMQAAICISAALAKAFPDGKPRHEFLENHFDPAGDFEAHLSGEPRHCVNRSAILATTLLSVGIPARIVSFTPKSGWGGHTLIEVWTAVDWRLVDPTELGALGSAQPISATEIKRVSGHLRLFNADGSVRQDPYPLSESIVQGELTYPEPWLYTRTGPRFSFWPFRGKVIQVGVHSWRFSTPLFLCRFAFVVSVLAGLYCLVCLLYSKGRIEAAELRLRPEAELELKAS